MTFPAIEMQLHYKKYGEGSPLIILHGLLGASGNWHTLATHSFGERFATYTVDQRNHGRSPHSEVVGYAAMAEDVCAFMDREDLSSACLLGHSMGGKTAMQVALAYPERVDKLVVVDIAPRAYKASHREILDALQALPLGQYGSRQEIDQALARRISSSPIRQFLLKNLVYDKEAGVYSWQMNLEALDRGYEEINAAVGNGKAFDKPVLFVRGGQSDYITEEDEAGIKKLFPKAEIATVPGAGHWVHAEVPQAFAEVVLAFLNR